MDSAGDVGANSSIALGPDGNPVIAYTDSGNTDLKLARCNDPACAGQNEAIITVDSAGLTPSTPSLTLDTDLVPVISYMGSGDLRVARPAGG